MRRLSTQALAPPASTSPCGGADGAKYTALELDQIEDGYPLRAELAAKTGRTSVPAVFVGGEFAGGCNDGGMGGVVSLDRQGKLRTLLTEAGAL